MSVDPMLQLSGTTALYASYREDTRAAAELALVAGVRREASPPIIATRIA